MAKQSSRSSRPSSSVRLPLLPAHSQVFASSFGRNRVCQSTCPLSAPTCITCGWIADLSPTSRQLKYLAIMTQQCALCNAQAAIYCVNDDALLCTACDAATHASNPLLARHERRPLPVHALCASEACASEACALSSRSPAASDLDVAVVPQLVEPCSSEEEEAAASEAAAASLAPAWPPAPPRASFDASGRSFAADLLDLDLPMLDAGFKELDAKAEAELADACVVPAYAQPTLDALDLPAGLRFGAPAAFGSAPSPLLHAAPALAPGFVPAQPATGFGGTGGRMVPVAAAAPLAAYQPSAYQPLTYQPQASSFYSNSSATTQLVPQALAAPAFTSAATCAPAHAPVAAPSAEEREREERLRRQRAQQRRSKRALGRTVRYQSRKAYAMIRPRIKGRFVRRVGARWWARLGPPPPLPPPASAFPSRASQRRPELPLPLPADVLLTSLRPLRCSPEEWEAHLATQAGAQDAGEPCMDSEAGEEAVVPSMGHASMGLAF